MTFAPRDILRKIPTGPNPPPSDLFTLYGSKLRLLFDAGVGVFQAPGSLRSWTDDVSEALRLSAASDGQRPPFLPDGTFFRGRPVVRLGGSASLSTPGFPSAIAGLNTAIPMELAVVFRSIAAASGFTSYVSMRDAAGTTRFSLQTASNSLASLVNGRITSFSFTDTIAVHMVNVVNTPGETRMFRDGALITTNAAAQSGANEIRSIDMTSADAFVAQVVVLQPPATDEERATMLAISGNTWGF